MLVDEKGTGLLTFIADNSQNEEKKGGLSGRGPGGDDKEDKPPGDKKDEGGDKQDPSSGGGFGKGYSRVTIKKGLFCSERKFT